MPNLEQQELLNSLIGKEGIYSKTIRDAEAFNLGTKVLYLERAITQNCQTFLQSLDKLYNPGLNGATKIANLEFIRALKLINDFHFNNQIQFGVSESDTREALTHYFSYLGKVDVKVLQIAVKEIIDGEIATLRQDHEAEIAEQKTKRATEEESMVTQTGWREVLELPQDQSAPMGHGHHHAFFQPMPLVPQIHLIPVRIQILIQARVMTQADAVTLSRKQLNKLDYTQPLISKGRMSVEDALALNDMKYPRFQREEIFTLIQEGLLTVDQFNAFSEDQIDKLVCTQLLISNERMSVEDALALTGKQHLNLQSKEIFTLIQEGLLTLDKAKTLSRVHYDRLTCTQPLISNGRMSVEDALALTGNQHLRLNSKQIFILIQAGGLTVDQAKALSSEKIDKLVCTQPLISNRLMSVEDALALTGNQHISFGPEKIFTLIQAGRLTVDQAKALSSEQIDSINLGNEDDVLHQLGQQPGFNH